MAKAVEDKFEQQTFPLDIRETGHSLHRYLDAYPISSQQLTIILQP